MSKPNTAHLTPLSASVILEMLTGKEDVHSLSAYASFFAGCDLETNSVIASINTHGCWLTHEDMRPYDFGHDVVIIDKAGALACIELTIDQNNPPLAETIAQPQA